MQIYEIRGPLTENELNKTNYNFQILWGMRNVLQTQINDLVLQEGNSPLEVRQARGGERVLNDRLNKFDSELSQTSAGLGSLDYRKADKKDLDALNDRISDIITTPADGISVEEIIDARDSEDSLGDNIRGIKSEVEHDIRNKVTNGNFASGTSGWTATSSTISIANNNLRITGNGSNARPRAYQRISGGFVGGNKVYVKGDFRVSNTDAFYVGFSLYRSGQSGVTVRSIFERHPAGWTWVRVEGIIALPNDGVGDLEIQVYADYSTAENSSGKFFEVNNLVFIDLTEAFGAGKDPSLTDIRSLLSSLPNSYFDEKMKLADLELLNITNKANKTDLSGDVVSAGFRELNNLPVNRKKFNVETFELLGPNKSVINDKTSMYIDRNVTFNGNPTFVLTSQGGASRLNSDFGETDLSGVDYIDFYLYVEDISTIENLQISLLGVGGHSFTSINLKRHINEVKENGYRMIRIPRDEFLVTSGSPSWSGLRYVRPSVIASSGTTSIIRIIKIEASKIERGALYMYFDDATIDHYEKAFPIMEKYGLTGTIAVPTARTERPNKASWSQLREMHNAGWLVVSHGLNERSLAEIPIDEAEEEIRKSSQMLFDRGFTFGSKCIVAPQGSWSEEVDKVAKKYLALCRTTGYPRTGRTERAMEHPQNHPRAQYYRSPVSDTSLDEVKGWVDNIIAKKKEFSMAWHVIDNNATDDYYAVTEDFFEEVCAYVRQKIDEGVLNVVTWQDTMLQSVTVNAIDTEGNQYLVSDNGSPAVLSLPIEKDE